MIEITIMMKILIKILMIITIFFYAGEWRKPKSLSAKSAAFSTVLGWI